jgi:hypothetical protein
MQKSPRIGAVSHVLLRTWTAVKRVSEAASRKIIQSGVGENVSGGKWVILRMSMEGAEKTPRSNFASWPQ